METFTKESTVVWKLQLTLGKPAKPSWGKNALKISSHRIFFLPIKGKGAEKKIEG